MVIESEKASSRDHKKSEEHERSPGITGSDDAEAGRGAWMMFSTGSQKSTRDGALGGLERHCGDECEVCMFPGISRHALQHVSTVHPIGQKLELTLRGRQEIRVVDLGRNHVPLEPTHSCDESAHSMQPSGDGEDYPTHYEGGSRPERADRNKLCWSYHYIPDNTKTPSCLLFSYHGPGDIIPRASSKHQYHDLWLPRVGWRIPR